MKIFRSIALIILFPLSIFAQNPAECDSVYIDCCTFNTIAPNSVTIEAANHSSNIFSYPAFVLFDMNSDTIGIEEVFYFGIGYNYQPHTISLVAPLDLPFEGYLELHSGFLNALECTFPIYIPDSTTTSVIEINKSLLSVYPNPSTENVPINLSVRESNQQYHVRVVNSSGQVIFDRTMNSAGVRIPANIQMNPGLYFIQLLDNNSAVKENQKLIIK